MDPLTQRREIFILLLWTVFCFGFGRRDAPTANLTIAPKAALERSYMHFFCKVTGFPAPNITWYKNDSAIRRLPWFTRLPVAGGEYLRLGSMRWYRHDGVYHCRASNEVGTATSKKSPLMVYKVKRSPQEFPKIIKQTFGQRIYTGDDARYECNATGNPAPKISWMVDKLPVNLSNPRYSLPSPGVLTVANIQQGDHGTLFECVATNIHGMVYSRGTTLMHKFRYSAPVISKPPQPVTVDPETVVYLYCSANGLPHPAILWERDGQSYSSAETTYGKLVIPNIQESGKYTCVAENHFGRTRASAYVTVRKLPFTPSRPTASEITPHTITITWRPGVGGPPVKSFTVYHRTKSSSDWTVVTGISGRDSLTLENLKPYTTYQFRVFALNEVGTSKPSSLLEVTTHEKAPGTVPRNIQARGISDNSFEATWLPPLEPNGLIYGYRLFYTTDLTTDFSLWRYKPSAENETVVERLQRHTTYYFRIAAYNVIGQGPLTGLYAVKVARGAPGQPEAIQVTVLTPRVIHVSWKPPKYKGNGVFGYEIHYNKSSRGIDETISVTELVLGREIRDLRPYTYYKVQVVATSIPHDGPRSFAKVVRTSEAAPSGPPQNIRSKALQDSTSLEINWDPPLPEHRNGRITNYTVRYKEKGGRARSVTVDGSKTSIRLHSLKKYTPYYVWVSASTSVSVGPTSKRHEFTTAEDVPSGAPRKLNCVVKNSSAIEVSWKPPSQTQEGRIQGYTVFYTKVDDQGNSLQPPAMPRVKHTRTGNDLVLLLTHLVADTTYLIQVAAFTKKGDGAKSIPRLAKTFPKPPDPPHIVGSIRPSSDVLIRWLTVDTGVLSYKLRYGKSLKRLRGRQMEELEMKEMTALSKNSHTFKGLDPGVWYLFKISVRNKVGWSKERFIWVETAPAPPSGPPLDVRASTLSSISVQVTWKKPDQWKRNGPLIGYSVVYNPLYRMDLSMVKNVTNPNQTNLDVTDLMMYTDYEIRVRAHGSMGPGPLSLPVITRTAEGAPSPPLEPSAVARTSEKINVSWKAPKFPHGVVLSYLVIYSSVKHLPLSQWSSTAVKGMTVTIQALSRDTQYWIRVAARTSAGQGNYSSPTTARTPKYDLPGACRDLKASFIASEAITLSWRPPVTDAAVIKYKISYSASKNYTENGAKQQLTHDQEVGLDATSTGLQSYTIDGLVPYTKYMIAIWAVNSIGDGRKIKITTETDKGNPPPLKGPVIMEDDMTNEFIQVQLETASERNGPISYYLIIIVPLGNSNQLPEDQVPDDFFKEVRRRKRNPDNVKEEPYIAAKFRSEEMPKKFNVGDKKFKNRYGYNNKELTKGVYYTMFTRAYVRNNKGDSLFTSSPFSIPVKFGDKNGLRVNAGARKGEEPNEGQELNLTLIIIPVAAVVVITALVALAVYLWRRRRRGGNKKSKSMAEENEAPSDPVVLKRMTIQTPGLMDHPPINVNELSDRIRDMRAESNAKFTQEYESIEPGQTFTSDASLLEYNRSKNRYPNILAFDHSRVHLSMIDEIPGSDYINANFCDGYRKENAYIATQGPLEDTIDDFWRMIWEFKTFTIVMLTELEERGRVKCEQYWPTEGTGLYGEIEVTVSDWVEFANYAITTLQVSKQGAPHREVKHFQFSGWPDHGVPPHPTPFLAFLRRVRFYNPTDAGPIVVHCSAGVGRTACFIVIDSMLERLKHENTVDVYGHVTVLRTQRNFMVQTDEQYIFIHDSLLEAVTCGTTEVHARNLLQHIKRLREPVEGGMLGLTNEFRKLSNPHQARREKQGTGSLPINRSKNRLANILPYESNRVVLLSARGTEGSDYINASYIDGYRQRFAYIATQAPLNDTVDDFWRMLMEHNSNIIVMLTQLHEGDRERCCKYWPTDRSEKYQYYVVDPISEQEYSTFVMRDFKVKDAKSGTVRNIKQFHFFGWSDSKLSESGGDILDLIGQVQKAYEQQGEEGPITVHCSDGVGRTGVFCALCIVLERMRCEGVVDLFQTVKLLRTQRPNMIQNQEQYMFCYQKALEYLSSFDHYAV
ncbi:receptor-type tyrosine-protein phosphatase delta-like isoform X2 [Acropora muricata]|uniref:receptor-type tyrosine-protein phosphatase delta-like isoform X2 n=1 Tax=Acropora muricata TaxID=159855 RepID=UPI0034E464FF